jgi:hypothetical protein
VFELTDTAIATTAENDEYNDDPPTTTEVVKLSIRHHFSPPRIGFEGLNIIYVYFGTLRYFNWYFYM